MVAAPIIVPIVLLLLLIFFSLRIVTEYERLVVFFSDVSRSSKDRGCVW